MSNEQSPFELLKSFSGLIHRQPLFINHCLDVDSYHFTFLDKQGEKLPEDAEAPAFITQLTDILPTLSSHRKALLSIPRSWREALSESHASTLQLIFCTT